MSEITANLVQVAARRDRFEGTVIFVHGLDGDAFTTWGGADKDDPMFWPIWLKGDAQNIEIYSLGYNASSLKARNPAQLSLKELGIVIYDTLRSADPKIFDAPIAFVCHSLGGIIIKQVLRQASDALNDPFAVKLLDNVVRVVFIATPHGGTATAKAIASYAPVLPTEILKGLGTGNPANQQLGDWYREFSGTRKETLKNIVYYEKEKTRFFGLISATVVDEASADPKLPGVAPIPLVADHISISKPKTRSDRLYLGVLRELSEMVDRKPRKRPASEQPERAQSMRAWMRPVRIAAGVAAVALVAGLATQVMSVRPSTSMPMQPAKPPTPVVVRTNQIETDKSAAQTKAKYDADERARQQLAIEREQLSKARLQAERAATEARAEAKKVQEARLETERRLAEELARTEAAQQALRKLDAEKLAAADAHRQTLAVQDGLRRAGCYSGPVNGKWGPETKKAVGRFNSAGSKQGADRIQVDAPTPEAERIAKALKSGICPDAAEASNVERVATRVTAKMPGCTPGTVAGSSGQCEAPYVLWIGYDETEAAAGALFRAIQQRHADILSDRKPEIRPRGNPTRYAVRVGPADGKEAMQAMCNRLRAAGFDKKCWPEPLQ